MNLPEILPHVVVIGRPGVEAESLHESLRSALTELRDPLDVHLEQYSGDGENADDNLVIELRGTPTTNLKFIGSKEDHEIDIVARAIHARNEADWFEAIYSSQQTDPIAILQRHSNEDRDAYVSGFLLAQYDQLRKVLRSGGNEIRLVDILRPVWIRGNPTSALFVMRTGRSLEQMTLRFGTIAENFTWTWQFSIDVSRTTDVDISLHEVPSENVPPELRQFASLANLGALDAPEVQFLVHSQDFEKFIEELNEFRRSEATPTVEPENPLTREQALEEAVEELQELVGLKDVKRAIAEFTNYMKVARERKQQGLDAGDISTHFVFSGSPGTGKTTVARLIGKILYGLEMLSGYETHEVLRSDLVAGYVGQTAIKTREVIEKAQGGVLFIDEAYSLAGRGEGQDFGHEAIETLLAEMENRRDDLCVVVAGYQDKMEQFLSSNPGLRGRFSRTLHFPDYSTDELVEIFCRIAESRGLILAPDVHVKVENCFIKVRASEQFSNARAVRQLIEDSVVRQANRVADSISTLSRDELQTLRAEDISSLDSDTSEQIIDEEGLSDSLVALDALIGLDDIKQRIHSFVDLARAQIRRRDAGMTNHIPTLTFVFSGPSGTGKTTVANLLGRIFLNLGLLRRGHTVVTTRADLVAGYVGQTAIRTREQVGRALDGVLFVDEAYSLTPGGIGTAGSDFGSEAIQELLTQMENNRHRLAIIFAGYDEEMDTFLDSNPGLRNRIGEIFRFPSYSSNDLSRILTSFATSSGYVVPTQISAEIIEYFERILNFTNAGQARAARTLLDDAIRFQANRLASFENPTHEDLQMLTIEDFRRAIANSEVR